jgi:1-phosphatidylinositol-3-phosphate 5-kinase
LVHPHSKNVLREAIKSDADFLARSNIMDYSYVYAVFSVSLIAPSVVRLLLGVDDTKKEIACGPVDTVGQSLPVVPLIINDPASTRSYTFAKTLEYKAKHGLQSGK